MAYKVEVTDTFGGEANYCWVRRYALPPCADTSLARVRAAKRVAGYAGMRSRTSDYGDQLRIDICGAAIVIFVVWEDEETDVPGLGYNAAPRPG